MTSIANGENGASVRATLNAALARMDELTGVDARSFPTAAYPNTTAGLAAAISAAGAATLAIEETPAGSLPASYTAVLDYEIAAPFRHFSLAAAEARTSKRLLRTQHAGGHADAAVYTMGIETRPVGSGKNGPVSADVGLGLSVIKQGFGGATRPAAGEMDGLYIVVRQDGPQGTASGATNSSDASGILVDAQIVGDAGFIAIADCQSSQIDATSFAFLRRMQVQAGAIIANAAGAPVSYGYTAVAKTGALNHAFYAGESGGTWDNILKAPGKLSIDGAGGYHIQTADWTAYAARFARGAGINDALTITQRGTGGINIATVEAASITLATSNVSRWAVTAGGTFQPVTDLGANLGAATLRVSEVYAFQLDLGTTSANGVKVRSGAGSPEGVLAAPVGSMWLRTDGGAATTLYIKESGTTATGWVAK